MDFPYNNNNCKYFDVRKFNNCFLDSNEILLTHANVRRFSKNADECIAYVNCLNIKIEIMCFSATWLRQKSNSEIMV